MITAWVNEMQIFKQKTKRKHFLLSGYYISNQANIIKLHCNLSKMRPMVCGSRIIHAIYAIT